MITNQVWAEAVVLVYGAFSMLWLLQWWLGQHIQGLALLIFGRPGPASSLYFYLLAPGVIIHELSHWLVAKLLLVRTGDFALFRPDPKTRANGKITLGYVEVYRSDPIRQSLIGLAPLPVGIAVLLLLSALLGFDKVVNNQLTTGNWQVLAALPGRILASLGQPLNILWLYLAFAVGNGMLPSAPDRRPWLFGFILPGLLIVGLIFNGNLKLALEWQQALLNLLGTLTWVFAFAALLNLLLAVCIALFEAIFSRLSRRKIVYRR